MITILKIDNYIHKRKSVTTATTLKCIHAHIIL